MSKLPKDLVFQARAAAAGEIRLIVYHATPETGVDAPYSPRIGLACFSGATFTQTAATRVVAQRSSLDNNSLMSDLAKEWLLMIDGASRGNPGQAGCGAAIFDDEGTVVKELSRYLGRATNNVAEYEGLLMGLEAMHSLGRKRILVQSDSELLVRQLNGEYRVKDEKLKLLYQRALSLLRQFDSYRILHVRREMNKLADRLANRGIDDAVKTKTTG